jgi:hypothetical protein
MWAAESHANILAANALAGLSWAKTKRTLRVCLVFALDSPANARAAKILAQLSATHDLPTRWLKIVLHS